MWTRTRIYQSEEEAGDDGEVEEGGDSPHAGQGGGQGGEEVGQGDQGLAHSLQGRVSQEQYCYWISERLPDIPFRPIDNVFTDILGWDTDSHRIQE